MKVVVIDGFSLPCWISAQVNSSSVEETVTGSVEGIVKMNWSRLIPERRIFILPLIILLPFSIIFYGMSLSIYRSAGSNPEIYTDVMVRVGMSLGPMLVIPVLIGSMILFVAMCELLFQCIRQRRLLWTEMRFVLFGLMCHPWVIGSILAWWLG